MIGKFGVFGWQIPEYLGSWGEQMGLSGDNFLKGVIQWKDQKHMGSFCESAPK